jgi:hypothetical protein
MSGPIHFTDTQLDAIMRAATPLAPVDRGAFLEAVASALRGRQVGDGAVYLAITTAQRRFWAAAARSAKAGQVGSGGPEGHSL